MKLKVLLLITALATTMSAWADEGDEFTVDDLKYQITSEDNKWVEVTGYAGSTPLVDLEIPESVKNGGKTYKVKSIGANAFSGSWQSLKSVNLPYSVESIGNYAFIGCYYMTSLNIAYEDYYQTLTSIGEGAFAYCTSLTTVYLPRTVTSIGEAAFAGCQNVTDVYCLADPTNLSWVNAGEDFMADHATKCHVKKGTDWSTFSGVNVTFEDDLIGDYGDEFEVDGLKYRVIDPVAKEIMMYYANYETTIGDVVIPASIYGYSMVWIGWRGFHMCDLITSVAIPESVRIIDNEAFYGCRRLKNITIPANVTYIGDEAFENCRGLTSIVIPASVTYIGNSAFANCYDLTSIAIPANVTYIGGNAFLGCYNMKDVYCFADPTALTWENAMYDFTEYGYEDNKPTCHVKPGTDWSSFESKVNATFVYDMANTVLVDGLAYTEQSDKGAASATFQKTISSSRVGKHQAWMVPFDYTITEDDEDYFQFYKINMIANSPDPSVAATDEMWVFLKPIGAGTVLHANMPYVFKPKQAVNNYNFTTENTMVRAATEDVVLDTRTAEDIYSFYAIYQNTNATPSNPFYYVNINGSISYGNNVTVGPFRWIIRKTSKFASVNTVAYAREMKFVVDGEVEDETSIEGLTTDNGQQTTDGWYNVNGVRLSQKPTAKGIYIHNGRKEAVR